MWQEASFWKSMVKLVSQDYVGLLEVQYVGFNSVVFCNSLTFSCIQSKGQREQAELVF